MSRLLDEPQHSDSKPSWADRVQGEGATWVNLLWLRPCHCHQRWSDLFDKAPGTQCFQEQTNKGQTDTSMAPS